MTVQSMIEAKLQQGLRPVFCEVVNESAGHNVPPGSETHFKVVIVADAFSGKSLVARHRDVYDILREEVAAGVHALALHTYTPDEWRARAAPAPASPACRGGGRS